MSEDRDDQLTPFERDIIAYRPRLLKACLAMLTNVPNRQEAAEDIVQDTFLRACRSQARAEARFRGDAQTYSWLYRISQNLIRDFFRRSKNNPVRKAISLDVPMGSGSEASDLLTSRIPETSFDDRILLEEVMRDQPDAVRTLVELRLQGFMNHEIGSKLGIKTETVKSRYFRFIESATEEFGGVI